MCKLEIKALSHSMYNNVYQEEICAIKDIRKAIFLIQTVHKSEASLARDTKIAKKDV